MGETIDEKIAQINDGIRDIDAEINNLKDMKQKLLAEREKLECKKFNRRQKDLQSNDWKDGENLLETTLDAEFANFMNFFFQQDLSLGANRS